MEYVVIASALIVSVAANVVMILTQISAAKQLRAELNRRLEELDRLDDRIDHLSIALNAAAREQNVMGLKHG